MGQDLQQQVSSIGCKSRCKSNRKSKGENKFPSLHAVLHCDGFSQGFVMASIEEEDYPKRLALVQIYC